MTNLVGIEKNVGVEIEIGKPMRAAIDLWNRMYVNQAPWLSEEVVSMNLPALIACEVARMATLEMKSAVGGSKRADFLNSQYERIIRDIRICTEYAAAGGSLALKPYVDGKRIAVDYAQAGRFFPTAFNASAEVMGGVFIDTLTRGDRVYTRVEHHRMEEDGCHISNKAYRARLGDNTLGEAIPLTEVEEWADIMPEAVVDGVDRPLFAILKMPFANTIDPESPLGISAYAKAVDLIREADKQFSRVLWEMESGQRALYVDLRAFAAEESDPGTLPFRRFYRMMDIDPASQGELYKEWSPDLRVREQLEALNAILQKIEDACSLSRGTLSEAPESRAGGAKTATELKIMRQRTYALVRDTQKAIENALRQLLWAMDVWCSVANLAPAGKYDASFEFDDSIVSDRVTEFAERLQLVSRGVMQEWEMRAWYMGETEEVAKANIKPPPVEEERFPGVE